jgi:hypothetical protein
MEILRALLVILEVLLKLAENGDRPRIIRAYNALSHRARRPTIQE